MAGINRTRGSIKPGVKLDSSNTPKQKPDSTSKNEGRWSNRKTQALPYTVQQSTESILENTAKPSLMQRSVSNDSGIGSIDGDYDQPIDGESAQEINKALARVYQMMNNIGGKHANLPRMYQALESGDVQDLMTQLEKQHLEVYGITLFNDIDSLLEWSEIKVPPPIPKELKAAEAKYKKLQLKAEHLTRKVNKNPSSRNVAAAIKAGDKRDLVRDQQFKPEQKKLDQTLFKMIDQNPDFQAFCDNLASLKEKVPEDSLASTKTETGSPIDSTVRTWLYNILLDRTRLLDNLRPE